MLVMQVANFLLGQFQIRELSQIVALKSIYEEIWFKTLTVQFLTEPLAYFK